MGGDGVYINQTMKMECFIVMAETRKWDFLLLVDLRYKDQEVREYDRRGGKWVYGGKYRV